MNNGGPVCGNGIAAPNGDGDDANPAPFALIPKVNGELVAPGVAPGRPVFPVAGEAG